MNALDSKAEWYADVVTLEQPGTPLITQKNPQREVSARMAFWRVSSSSSSSVFRQISMVPSFTIIISRPVIRSFSVSASLSTEETTTPPPSSPSVKRSSRWKPMCLYYTQGKCTKVSKASPLP